LSVGLQTISRIEPSLKTAETVGSILRFGIFLSDRLRLSFMANR
jgi:hypothetical protein